MMRLMLIIIFLGLFTFVYGTGLNEEFTWTRITYRWPKSGTIKSQVQTEARNRGQGRYMTGTGGSDSIIFDGQTNKATAGKKPPQEDVPSFINYRHENNLPIGANVWKNKLFITIPRRQVGIPSTLNYVPLDSPVRQNVPLIPYPSWETNLYPAPDNNPDILVSMYRIAIDTCDRLWAVDTGMIEGANATRVKPTTIIGIDLKTDQIIYRYQIPEGDLRPTSALISVTVDVTKETCDDAYLYIADLLGYGVVVYSLKQNKSWRVRHNYFYLESTAGDLSIAGYNFQWADGIFTVELSDFKPDGYRDMFFHSFVGTHTFKVSTRIMRNQTLATRSYHGNDFKIVGDRGATFQSNAADIHKPSSVMVMGLPNQNAVGCWNINKPLSTISIVHRDDQKMVYPSDVKVSNDRIYVLTNKLPRFFYGRLNYDEINFRVWSNTIGEAIQSTECV